MKRLLSAIAALVALACFAGCLCAIWWIWSVKAPAIEKTTHAFDEADHYLSIADDAVGDVNNQLQTQTALVQVTARNDGNGFFGSFFGKTIVRQLAPTMNNASVTLQRVTEASIVVNSILGSLQEGSFGSIDKLDPDELRRLQTQMDAVTKASWDLLSQAKDAETTAQKSQRIAAGLQVIVDMLTEFHQRIASLRDQLRETKTRTLFWMNTGPTLAMFGLAWVAISQLVVLRVAVASMRRKRIV
jgi:hypothetical protein